MSWVLSCKFRAPASNDRRTLHHAFRNSHPEVLIVPGNAAVTATNILAHEPLFRLSFAAKFLIPSDRILSTDHVPR